MDKDRLLNLAISAMRNQDKFMLNKMINHIHQNKYTYEPDRLEFNSLLALGISEELWEIFLSIFRKGYDKFENIMRDLIGHQAVEAFELILKKMNCSDGDSHVMLCFILDLERFLSTIDFIDEKSIILFRKIYGYVNKYYETNDPADWKYKWEKYNQPKLIFWLARDEKFPFLDVIFTSGSFKVDSHTLNYLIKHEYVGPESKGYLKILKKELYPDSIRGIIKEWLEKFSGPPDWVKWHERNG